MSSSVIPQGLLSAARPVVVSSGVYHPHGLDHAAALRWGVLAARAVGFLIKIPILWTIGIIVLIIGLVLLAMGSMGRAVGGRKHYY